MQTVAVREVICVGISILTIHMKPVVVAMEAPGQISRTINKVANIGRVAQLDPQVERQTAIKTGTITAPAQLTVTMHDDE